MTAPSALMCVGREYYKLHEYVSEAQNHGVSKRVPATAIPEGLVKYESKIFLAHPDAIVCVTEPGKTLEQLAYKLFELNQVSEKDLIDMVDTQDFLCDGEDLNPEDFVPAWMLIIALGLSRLEDKVHAALVKEYGLKFIMGIFGFAYFEGFQYVAGVNETSLPEHLKHLEGYVEPVHVVYQENEDENNL